MSILQIVQYQNNNLFVIISGQVMKFSTIYFVLQNQNQTLIYTYSKLLEPITTSTKQSNSVLLSLAEFLTQTFPNLMPPQMEVTGPLSTTFLMNLWMRKFVFAVQNSHALRHNDVLHIKIKICESYGQKLVGLGFCVKEYKQFRWQYCHPSLEDKQQIISNIRRKIAMCLCNDPKENINIKDVNLPAVYMGIFYNNQDWKVFNVVRGEIPSVEELKQTSVVIVPGSDLSVYNLNQNINAFANNFIQASTLNFNLKYLGICFGMQLLCWAFGGRVEKAKKCTTTVQKIFLNKEILKQYHFYQDWWQRQHIAITSYHSDEVVQVPPNFKILAHSLSCEVQVVISVDSRFFGLQGHPDYSVDYMEYYNVSQQCEVSRFTYLFEDQFDHTRKAINTFLSHEHNKN